MKNVKKLLSIVMVLTLVLSLGASAFAATVTIESKTGLPDDHDYVAYQIFSGTQADPEVTDGPLGNVVWGKDINGPAFLAVLKSASIEGVSFADCESAADVAKALEGKDSDVVKAFGKLALANLVEGAEGEAVIAGQVKLDPGYYVIKDTTTGLDDGEVLNDIVVEVTGGDITIEAKNEGPTSQKKVKDVNDSTGEASGWQDSADYDIGDTVPYQLKAELKALSHYETYYLKLIDTLSAGLTYNNDARIFVGATDPDTDGDGFISDDEAAAAHENEITTQFTTGSAAAADGTTYTWEDTNILDWTKAADSVTVWVYYTATLNDNAKIGQDGNPNVFNIEFSRNPNGDEHGETKDDKVTVFTFTLDVKKVDDQTEPQPLAGAGFTLLKEVPAAPAGATTVTELKGEDLKAGNYYSVNGKTYEIIEVKGAGAATEFEFKGLDDGNYMIVETETPNGYNTIPDVTFTVKAEHNPTSDDPTLTTLEVTDINPTDFTFNAVVDSGSLSTTIVNESGATLPETGGIGTTIFYIVGAVLVAGAVILLVTKKRVSGAEK